MYEGTTGGAGNGKSFGHMNATNALPPPSKASIEAHSGELHQAIAEAAERLRTLELRLSPILTPDGPTGAGCDSAAPPCRSPLADSFVNARGSVLSLAAAIDRLMCRIEL